MKFFATAITAAILLTMAWSEAFAGVSISVGDPGFYGQIDIGNYPPPQLIYSQPVVVGQVVPGYQPIYLRVPPKHRDNWQRYCHRYNACGRPVYFVHDTWYRDVYAPRYRENRRVVGPPPPPRPMYNHPPQYDHRPGPPPQYDHRPGPPPQYDHRPGPPPQYNYGPGNPPPPPPEDRPMNPPPYPR